MGTKCRAMLYKLTTAEGAKPNTLPETKTLESRSTCTCWSRESSSCEHHTPLTVLGGLRMKIWALITFAYEIQRRHTWCTRSYFFFFFSFCAQIEENSIAKGTKVQPTRRKQRKARGRSRNNAHMRPTLPHDLRDVMQLSQWKFQGRVI